jgi:hypothetical protein
MNKDTRRHSRILFVLSILPPTAWVAYAQSTTSLRGTVSDSWEASSPLPWSL